MPSKRLYIIIFVVLVVFGVVMFVFWGVPSIRQENIEGVFIVGDNTTWVYQNQTWSFMRYNTSMEQYNWQEFYVYEDNQLLGNYYLWHDDKWYAFKENREAINIPGKFFAFQSNVDLKVFEFEELPVDDYTYVYEVLKENGLPTDSEYSSIYKVLLDYDGDTTEEEFYIITNALPIDFQPEKTFAIAFMVKNDIIYPIYTDVSSNRGLNGCKPFYHTFVDTNYDGVSEIVLSCGQFSATEEIDMLYQFVDGKFNLLISNQ